MAWCHYLNQYHYLNQCWLMINNILQCTPEENFNVNHMSTPNPSPDQPFYHCHGVTSQPPPLFVEGRCGAQNSGLELLVTPAVSRPGPLSVAGDLDSILWTHLHVKSWTQSSLISLVLKSSDDFWSGSTEGAMQLNSWSAKRFHEILYAFFL